MKPKLTIAESHVAPTSPAGLARAVGSPVAVFSLFIAAYERPARQPAGRQHLQPLPRPYSANWLLGFPRSRTGAPQLAKRGADLSAFRPRSRGTIQDGAGSAVGRPSATSAYARSGRRSDPLYTPDNVEIDYERDLGYPGVYPFTRGVYPSMYRGKLWTMRQFAGFGTAEETNARFRYLLEHGQTGLSTAFDMPTLMGYDSDHARSLGEVGREGVAIDSRRHGDALRRHSARRGPQVNDMSGKASRAGGSR
jgi:Methylmalonyl-CoA mutase